MIIRLTTTSGHSEFSTPQQVLEHINAPSYEPGTYGYKVAMWLINCEKMKKDHAQIHLPGPEGQAHTWEWHDFRTNQR